MEDDTAVWFTHAIRNAGAEVALLLRGDAGSYAQAGQDARGLRFGTREVRVAPELDRDLRALAGQGVAVYVVEEDLRERGIPADVLLPGVERVGRDRLAELIDGCDRVIRW